MMMSDNTIVIDDKTTKMIKVLAQCAEEAFDKAKVVQQKEIVYLAAARYMMSLIEGEKENVRNKVG
jgi:hypothetical protein